MASGTVAHIPDSALNSSCFLACFKIYPPKPDTLRLIEKNLMKSSSSSPPYPYTPMNHRPDYHSDNVFVAKFDSSDEARIFDAAPHIFRGDLIAVKRYVHDNSPSDYDFHVSPFWIRIYDLPLDCLTAQVARIVASALGTNARGASDDEIRRGSKKFARVRVDIDVSNPLEESLRLRLPNDEEITARIMYERLPNHCSYCGLVGHLDDTCPGPEEDRVRRRYRRSSLTVAPPSSPRMTPVAMTMSGRRQRRTGFQSVSQHFRRFSGHG